MSSPLNKLNMDIVVVGGSLAGLMASIALLRLGHTVTILERSPTPLLHDQGAGIVAGGETLEFAKRYFRAFRKEIAVVSPMRMYLDRKGGVSDREEWEQRMTSWDLLYHCGRAGFDGVKSEYLDDKGKHLGSGEGESRGVYEYGRVVKNVKERGEKVEVEFEDVRQNNERSKGKIQKIIADFLIAADGPSSAMRRMLIPDAAERTYAGYVAFRGTVPESQLSKSAAQVFVERFTFFHGPATQILAYTIPGTNGTLETGQRLVNWVWYWNFAEDSPELQDLMTDTDGNKHRFTLPSGGKMQPHVWQRQKELAENNLAPQFAELVNKTANPFVQAITDLPSPPAGTRVARLLNGKALVVGDALSGFRPHTAASTGQAALHALLLESVFKGHMDWDEYEERVSRHARSWQERGVMLGTRSQFGRHPLADGEGQERQKKEVDRGESLDEEIK